MKYQKQIDYNIKSSKKFGWAPDWFGASDFDDDLIEKVRSFQTEMNEVVDGLVGRITFTLKKTERESEDDDIGYIIKNGVKHDFGWPTLNFDKHIDIKLVKAPPRPEKKKTMIVVHHDAALSCASMVTGIRKRGYSTHFGIDNDGTIWQTADIDQIATHAGIVNNVAIGIDVSNAWYTKYNKWYENNGFGPRPVMNTKIHGVQLVDYLAPYPVQVEALAVLLKKLHDLTDIPLEVPQGPDGEFLYGVHKEAANAKFNGVVCHFNLTRNKIDCSGIDLKKVCEVAKSL